MCTESLQISNVLIQFTRISTKFFLWKIFSVESERVLAGTFLHQAVTFRSEGKAWHVLWGSHVCKCKAVSQCADTCGRKQVIIRSFWCCDVPVPLPSGQDLATLLLLPLCLRLGRTERWHDSGFTFWCWKHSRVSSGKRLNHSIFSIVKSSGGSF